MITPVIVNNTVPEPIPEVAVSMTSVNGLLVMILMVSIAHSLCGEASRRQNLGLEVQKVTVTKYGYDVSIRVKNVSATAVTLARTGTASPLLQSLDVQQ